MKVNGKLVEIIIERFPKVYKNDVHTKYNIKTLYAVMKKALYGMIMSLLLFYRHLRNDLESIGFKVNPYDMRVANRNVDGHQ